MRPGMGCLLFSSGREQSGQTRGVNHDVCTVISAICVGVGVDGWWVFFSPSLLVGRHVLSQARQRCIKIRCLSCVL